MTLSATDIHSHIYSRFSNVAYRNDLQSGEWLSSKEISKSKKHKKSWWLVLIANAAV